MAKNVLKRNEFLDHTNIDFINIPSVNSTQALTKESLEVFSQDSLLEDEYAQKKKELDEKYRQEELQMQEQVEQHRIALIEEAQKEAQALLEESKKEIERREKESSDKVSLLIKEVEEEKELILTQANEEKEGLIGEAESKVEEIQEEAHAEGYNIGYEEAFKKSQEHLDHLFSNIQSIADYLLERRQEILKDSQGQLLAILLSAVRKIVYKLSETQEDLIISTLNEAFARVSTQTDIVLRVNPLDFNLVEEWSPKIQEHFKNLTSIKVFEDSKVERGGCIVETDFGEIDARIATQISRLEERILEINPMVRL